MKASIIPIGNSKGIRISKVLLKECNIENSVEITREGAKLVIRPVQQTVRSGWDDAFKMMSERNEDKLLLDEGIEEMEAFDWK